MDDSGRGKCWMRTEKVNGKWPKGGEGKRRRKRKWKVNLKKMKKGMGSGWGEGEMEGRVKRNEKDKM